MTLKSPSFANVDLSSGDYFVAHEKGNSVNFGVYTKDSRLIDTQTFEKNFLKEISWHPSIPHLLMVTTSDELSLYNYKDQRVKEYGPFEYSTSAVDSNRPKDKMIAYTNAGFVNILDLRPVLNGNPPSFKKFPVDENIFSDQKILDVKEYTGGWLQAEVLACESDNSPCVIRYWHLNRQTGEIKIAESYILGSMLGPNKAVCQMDIGAGICEVDDNLNMNITRSLGKFANTSDAGKTFHFFSDLDRSSSPTLFINKNGSLEEVSKLQGESAAILLHKDILAAYKNNRVGLRRMEDAGYITNFASLSRPDFVEEPANSKYIYATYSENSFYQKALFDLDHSFFSPVLATGFLGLQGQIGSSSWHRFEPEWARKSSAKKGLLFGIFKGHIWLKN